MTTSCPVREIELWDLADADGSGDLDLRRHAETCAVCKNRLARMQRLCVALKSISGDAECPLPESIGPYRILRVIGEGGMGIVYEAEQSEPRRRVAVKVMRLLTAHQTKRVQFKREIEALGRLNHPGISTIYDAGQTDSGEPWFAMELVEGRALDRHCDRLKLGLTDRIGLFRRVLDAVAEAHSCGVIHRDLKPANIVVDPAGRPRVLDFGLAQVAGSEFELSLTLSAVRPAGTLPFMSPEQFSDKAETLDARSDVYSLGVILYALVTGCYPLATQGTLSDRIRTITERAPILPSRVADVDKWLESIILKCLAKHREDRYESVAALAGDIDRYSCGQTVRARPVSIWRRQGAWLRRRPAVASAGAAFSLGILALLVTSMSYPGPNTSPVGERTALDRGMVLEQVELSFGRAVSPDGSRAVQADSSGNLELVELASNKRRFLTREASWEIEPPRWADQPVWSPDGTHVAYVWLSDGRSELRVVNVEGGEPVVWQRTDARPQAWSADGLLVTHTSAGSCSLSLLRGPGGTREEVRTWARPPPEGDLALSPDGRWLAYTRPARDGMRSIRTLCLETGQEERLTEPDAGHEDWGPVWLPDGGAVVFASDRAGSVDFWALAVNQGRPHGTPVLILGDVGPTRPRRFGPDGALYCSSDRLNKDVRIAELDPDTMQVVGRPMMIPGTKRGITARPAWSPNGRFLSFVALRGLPRSGVAAPRAVAREWRGNSEFETGLPRGFPTAERWGIPPRLSPDGRTWATVSGRRQLLHLITVANGEARELDTGVAAAVIWSADGASLFCVKRGPPDRVVRIDADSGRSFDVFAARGVYMGGVALSPNGQNIAVSDRGGIHVIPLAAPDRSRRVMSPDGSRQRFDLSWIGDFIVFNQNGRAKALDLRRLDAAPRELDLNADYIMDLAVHPQGTALAFAGRGPGGRRGVIRIPGLSREARRRLDR